MAQPITWTTEQIALENLIEWEKNPVILSDHDEEQIKISLETFGFVIPLVANQPTKAGNCRLIDGHQRKAIMLWSDIAKKETLIDVRIPNRKLTGRECDNLSLRLRRHMGRFDWQMIGKEFDMDWLMEDVGFLSTDFFEEGFGDDGDGAVGEEPVITLAERFIVPPFSVLDARQGYWQNRKRAWLDLGMKGELGRGGNLLHFDETAANVNFYNQKTKLEKELGKKLTTPQAKKQLLELGRIAPSDNTKEKQSSLGAIPSNQQAIMSKDYKSTAYNTGGPNDLQKQYQHVDGVLFTSDSGNDPAYYFKKQKMEKKLGRKLSTEEFQRDYYEGPDTYQSGTSIFDPVLCELAYRWFCPEGGLIINPTAGESVYGIVAGFLGYRYKGVELRAEQIEENVIQWDEISSAEAGADVPDKTNSVISIIPVTEKDEIKEITKLAGLYFDDGFLQYIPAGAYAAAVETGDLIKAMYGDELAGFALLVPKKRTSVLKIDQIAKVPDAIPGVGKRLFEYVCSRAKELSKAAVQLEVRKDNENAIGFYEHLGMTQIGENEKGDNFIYELIVDNPIMKSAKYVKPEWIEGDGRDIYKLVGEGADFIMCCPPYADLEVYSDNPKDLSTMDYPDFLKIYNEIIAASVKRLKNNRFAMFTVGDIRDKEGNYRNFVSDTISAFIAAGCALYNEAILVTAIGSLPIRVKAQFERGRKLGKTH